MAGLWIAWVKGLTRRREVVIMAAGLGLDRRMVAALWMELWEWLDEEGGTWEPEGEGDFGLFVSGVTMRFIDALLETPSFSRHASVTGWVQERDSGLYFPHFDRWNGSNAKERLSHSRRQRKYRHKCDTSTVTKAPPQKRREENIETASAVSPGKKPRTEKQVVRDALWDALVAEWKLPVGTPKQRSRIGGLVTELRGAGAAPAEIAVRRKRIVDAWGPEKATPESVVKHWSEFDGSGPGQSRVGRVEAAPGKYDGVMARAVVTGSTKRGGAAGGAELAFPAPRQEPSDRSG